MYAAGPTVSLRSWQDYADPPMCWRVSVVRSANYSIFEQKSSGQIFSPLIATLGTQWMHGCYCVLPLLASKSYRRSTVISIPHNQAPTPSLTFGYFVYRILYQLFFTVPSTIPVVYYHGNCGHDCVFFMVNFQGVTREQSTCVLWSVLPKLNNCRKKDIP